MSADAVHASSPTRRGRRTHLPVITSKHVTPHTAAHRGHGPLHAGVDTSVIALWLGHTAR